MKPASRREAEKAVVRKDVEKHLKRVGCNSVKEFERQIENTVGIEFLTMLDEIAKSGGDWRMFFEVYWASLRTETQKLIAKFLFDDIYRRGELSTFSTGKCA